MKIAVVGTGISGVTLALRLQQLGVDTTVWADRTPLEQRRGPIENLVARFPATQDREHVLGVAHWDDIEGYASGGIEVDVVGTGLSFDGRFDRPARAVDFRIYLSRLVEDYVERGGRVHVGALPTSRIELVERTANHDVVVVAAGRSAPVTAALFPVRVDRSPYSTPQRRLCGGLFTGVTQTDPAAVSFNIVPGAGEIFQQAFLTGRGVVSSILIEAVPGGPLEPITHIDHTADPAALTIALLRLIESHAPRLAARIDRHHFAPLGTRHRLQGSITPTVRHGWAPLGDGRVALAIGDAWIVNDPITGQGANIGSHCAWVTADALVRDGALDEASASRLESELWAFAGPVTAWTNAFLQPPPPHLIELLQTATSRQAVADAFANGFAEPARLAARLSTPEGCDELIHEALAPAGA